MARRSRTLSVVFALVFAIPMLTIPAFSQESTPPASPVAIPDSPVGQQLTWVLDQFNGDAATVTEQDIGERFHPAFLMTFPANMLIGLFQETATQYAPFELTGFLYPPTETGAIALVSFQGIQEGAITLAVMPEPPHLISHLDVGEAPPPPAATSQRVDIGERSLYINCTGEGSPTVVLEGGVSADWQGVQPAIERETRVCSYDRPDSPQTHSDPAPPRTAQQVVDDLSALLEAAGEEGPFVLVGHSLGGIYVQLFAYQHPEDVAGLVLLDPTPENFEAGLVELLRTLGTPIPDQAGPLTIDQTSYEQLKEARSEGELPHVPMILISHGVAPTAEERPPGWPVEEEEALFQRLHEDIVALVSGSRRIIAEESRHDIQSEQPDLVISAISDVVAAARDPVTWATPDATPSS